MTIVVVVVVIIVVVVWPCTPYVDNFVAGLLQDVTHDIAHGDNSIALIDAGFGCQKFSGIAIFLAPISVE